MRQDVVGRLVLGDEVVPGHLTVVGGRIAEIVPDPAGRRGPYVVPGFIDIHVHGWGGHSAMDGPAALEGMARALLARGVTTFLPTAVSASLPALRRFAADVRAWSPGAPPDGAAPAGFNLEGPFLAASRPGAHAGQHLLSPSAVDCSTLAELVDRLRVITVAPELDGALELIAWLAQRGVVVSLGHSGAALDAARAGYAAGARSTTHLFNAMSGVDHHEPGLAVAALADDEVAVELIADGEHVHPALWRIVARAKPSTGLLLVSDAIPLAGVDEGRGWLGEVEIEVRAGRATVAGSDVLAGSVIALDAAVRHLVAAGFTLPAAVAAASTNPARLLGLDDRGAIEPGRRADLVELDDDLRVVGVRRAELR